MVQMVLLVLLALKAPLVLLVLLGYKEKLVLLVLKETRDYKDL